MVKARLFPYRHSQVYYRKYGISPDRHFDRLCETYGTDAAIEIIDSNMLKAFESKWKEDKEREEREKRILESECPFT